MWVHWRLRFSRNFQFTKLDWRGKLRNEIHEPLACVIHSMAVLLLCENLLGPSLGCLSVGAVGAVRAFLCFQAFDTATHALLVRDMVRWDEESAETKLWLYRKLLVVTFVWAMHAIANVVSGLVTAGYVCPQLRRFVRAGVEALVFCSHGRLCA